MGCCCCWQWLTHCACLLYTGYGCGASTCQRRSWPATPGCQPLQFHDEQKIRETLTQAKTAWSAMLCVEAKDEGVLYCCWQPANKGGQQGGRHSTATSTRLQTRQLDESPSLNTGKMIYEMLKLTCYCNTKTPTHSECLRPMHARPPDVHHRECAPSAIKHEDIQPHP